MILLLYIHEMANPEVRHNPDTIFQCRLNECTAWYLLHRHRFQFCQTWFPCPLYAGTGFQKQILSPAKHDHLDLSPDY